ncbi:protein of unknown function [Cupriavidus taiwanensis]|nr:protein of unknown function [Cupriavidus taiwanensis]
MSVPKSEISTRIRANPVRDRRFKLMDILTRAGQGRWKSPEVYRKYRQILTQPLGVNKDELRADRQLTTAAYRQSGGRGYDGASVQATAPDPR